MVTPAAPPHLRAKRAGGSGSGSGSASTGPVADVRPSLLPTSPQTTTEPAKAAPAAAAPTAPPAMHRSPAAEKAHAEPKGNAQTPAAPRSGGSDPRAASQDNGSAGSNLQQPQQALAYLQAAKNAQKREQQTPLQTAPPAQSHSSGAQKGSSKGRFPNSDQGRAAAGNHPGTQQQQQQQQNSRGYGTSQHTGATPLRRRSEENAGKRSEGAVDRARPETGGEAGSDTSGRAEGQGKPAGKRRRNQRKGSQPQGQGSHPLES